jgi:hypothetical protein
MSGEKYYELLDQDIQNLTYFENPSSNVCWYGLHKDPEAIKYIENPTEEMWLYALNQQGCLLGYAKNNQTFNMCKTAIKQNWYAVSYVEIPNMALYKKAIKINVCAILYIKNPNVELYTYAKTRPDFNNIKFYNLPISNISFNRNIIEKKIYEDCVEIVKQNILDIKRLHKYAVCLAGLTYAILAESN